MPYTIRQINGKYCVVRRDTGENKGCSDTRAEAQQHMDAMHAAEHSKSNDDKAFQGKIRQEEAQYIALSMTPGQACANCRWFHANGDYMDREPHCHVVESYPEPILATGHSNRWEAVPQKMGMDEPIAVVIVEPPMEMDDSAEIALSVPKSMIERVKELINSLRPGDKLKDQAFQVFKTKDGKMAWIARHTGKWVDREGEILSEKSHERYTDRVLKGITPMPELWMWHAKGTRHGEAVAVWKSGGFALATGFIDDTAEGKRMFAYYQKNSGKIKLSHMFHYPRETKMNGVYHEYNTVEITTLPDGAEAFPYTSFEEFQTMALPEIARNMILEAGGQDMLDRAMAADSKAEKDTKTLDDQGVAWKGYDKYGDDIVPLEKVKALETAQTEIEKQLKALGDVSATFAQFNENIKQLNDKLETELKAKADLLEKINALEKKNAELTDLKPPASQSEDTLLNKREKSLIDSVMEIAKTSDQQSLIEKLLGVQPTLHS